MFSTISLQNISHDDFLDLKVGDTVFVKLGQHTFQSSVLGKPVCSIKNNYPNWMVQTTHGICEESKIFIRK